jgi:predicted Rossmann fold flavoprotein
MNEVVVIGGGAAGMMAAGYSARGQQKVTLLEKNERLGKKLLITGKGRCNFTNDAPLEQFIANMPGNGHFLFSAFRSFSNEDLKQFFQRLGVEVKTERGGRVFPASDKASEILDALQRFLQESSVQVLYSQTAERINVSEGRVTGVLTKAGKEYRADKVILATGGVSYPETGSTGDGYRLAEALGHSVTPLRPGLVPIEIKEGWVKDLKGLSLKNVELTVGTKEGERDGEFGEMIFTHFGISGPIVLTLSRRMLDMVTSKKEKLLFRLNLKPALSEDILLKRIQRDLDAKSKKQFKNCLDDLLPQRLIPVVIELSNISREKQAAQITKEERLALVKILQNVPLTFAGLRPLPEAIVTVGGVSVKEITPKTMESKKVRGLYICGELMDVDGYTGGYNLQAAFSTGYVAGVHASAWEA